MVLKIAQKVWFDGKFINWQEAKVSILSQSFQRGSTIFESVAFYNTSQGPAIFRLNDYVKRFFNSAKLMKMALPLSRDDFKKVIIETVKLSKLKEGGIRTLAFYKEPTGFLMPESNRAQVAVAVFRYSKIPTVARIKIAPFKRPFTQITKAKVAGNYALGQVANIEAQQAGFDDAVFFDETASLSEGPTSNIFIVKRGIIFTPPVRRVLEGITRDSVIKIAKDLGYQVKQKSIKKRELLRADEIFRTSTSVKLWPIIKTDDRIINQGQVGPITKRLQDTFEEIIHGRNTKYLKWLTFVWSARNKKI